MSEPDVVAELDHWRTTPRTAENAYEFVPISELLLRAREEIVGLREAKLARPSAYDIVRNQALEEAAQLIEEMPIAMALGVAKAIRALKEKH